MQHNYDLLLERQTRLYATAHSRGKYLSDDVSDRAEMLLLDDLTIFAISARRLIDLCCLQKLCVEKIVVQPVRAIISGDVLHFVEDGEAIGIYALMNRIIHMSSFMYMHSKSVIRHLAGFQQDIWKTIQGTKAADDHIDGLFVVEDAKYGKILVRLKDLIEASAVMAEAISKVCSSADIFLELSLRV